MVGTYKFTLEPYKGQRTRYTCPGCGKRKEFSRYIDTETGSHLADHVGKCNRKDSCGYHYTPRQFFRDNPEARQQEIEDWKHSEAWKTVYQPPKAPKEEPVQYLPHTVMERTLKGYQSNNFVRFLTSLFGKEEALQLVRKYLLGTSNKFQNAGGKAVVFWQIDRAGNVRQAKVMAYDPQTGKRLKEEGKHFVSFMGKTILKNKEANLQQCFFGEHLLPEFPGLPVALVESEKTAVVMAGFLPDVVWLATGGKNGARWTDRSVYKALEGRTVVIYPDLGAFDEWEERAKILGTVCSYQVSDLLEQNAQGNDWEEGYDLADYFIKEQAEAEQPTAQAEDIQAQENANKPTKEEQPAAQITAQADGLPPGWKYHVFDNGHRVLLNAEGYPATWDKPKDDLEKQAIEQEEVRAGIEASPLAGELIDRLGLELEKVEYWEAPAEAEAQKSRN